MKKRFKANNYAIESLAFKRTHPAPNRIPDSIRKKIADIKNKGGWRSCQHITELLPDELSDKEVQWMKSNSRHFLSISHDTVRNILKEQNIPQNTYQKEKPAIRFEMANFGELVQIDAHTVSNILGLKSIKLIQIIDDFSRTILAGRFFSTETTYNTLVVIREAIEKYGIFLMAYSDNLAIYNFILHTGFSHKVFRGNMGFYDYQVDPDKVLTQVEQRLLELGIPFLHHGIGKPQATGKIEKLWQLVESRFIKEQKYKVPSLKELNSEYQKWIKWYNTSWINRDTGCTPQKRWIPSVFKPLAPDTNLDDILCLKDTRVVAKDNTFSYDGSIYTISTNYNMVRSTVDLHIHPWKKIRVFYKGKFIQEFGYKHKKGDILHSLQGNLPNFRNLNALKTQIRRHNS